MQEKISVLTPLHENDYEEYKIAIASLAKHCTDFDKVELLVKIDSQKSRIEQLLNNYPFKHTVVCNELRGYENFGIFMDQMVAQASGSLFWSFCADCQISGDWVKEILNTRNTFKDNIYVANPAHWYQPVWTIEWYRVFNRITPKGVPDVDTWLRDLASIAKRYIDTPGRINIHVKHRPGHQPPDRQYDGRKTIAKRSRAIMRKTLPISSKLLLSLL